ncbi:MAG TPA: hypothetical protein VGS17_07715 [Candidatus Limnocylindria bacterium]|nr:hypothetical protein [Candidatus Limnocylindria bacterium]
MLSANIRQVGGACSVIVGISYVLVGITYFLLPTGQQPGGGAAAFYASMAQDPTFSQLLNWEFGLGAIFAFGAVAAIAEAVRGAGDGWTRWTTNLAIVGFAVNAISSFRGLAIDASIARAYVAADASAKAAIAATVGSSIDPQGWLEFGAVGVWIAVMSALTLRSGALPRWTAYVGFAAAVAYWLVVAGNTLGIPALIAVAAGLGGAVLAPAWFIGNGLALRRSTALASAASVTSRA